MHASVRNLLLTALLAMSGPPSLRADELVVADQDAHANWPVSAGAVFSLDPAGGTTADPAVLAAADAGAPFLRLYGLALSDRDGAAFVSDPGLPERPPAIYRIDCVTGALTRVATSTMFRMPRGLGMLGDGRLVVADPEADPAGLGGAADWSWHGAIFVIDVRACTEDCPVSVLSDGTLHSFGPTLVSAFSEPYAVEYDPLGRRLLVTDAEGPRAAAGDWMPCVYSVDVTTGAVALVAAHPSWVWPVAVAVEPGGEILLIDSYAVDESSVWRIDPSLPDPSANASLLSGGRQYAQLTDIDVDSSGLVHVTDMGEWDSTLQRFTVPPAIFEIDRMNTDPLTNAVLRNQSPALVTPLAIASRTGCSPPGRLVINRRARRDMAMVREQFAGPACPTAPWSYCVHEIVDAPLDGIVIPGEGAAIDPDSVWLYEHSDPVGTMKVRRAGADLIVSAN